MILEKKQKILCYAARGTSRVIWTPNMMVPESLTTVMVSSDTINN